MKLRALAPDDWAQLAVLRLHALKTEPNLIANLAIIEKWGEPEWRSIIAGKGVKEYPELIEKWFGLFDDKKLIGISRLHWQKGSAMADLSAGYLLPQYRGRGLAHLLYAIRYQYALRKRIFTGLESGLVCGNHPSERLMQNWGLTAYEEKAIPWPSIEKPTPVRNYRIHIKAAKYHLQQWLVAQGWQKLPAVFPKIFSLNHRQVSSSLTHNGPAQ